MNQKISDLLVFSHLRWDFVFQRPQHLLTRHAHRRRVFYIEEPHFDSHEPKLEVRDADEKVRIVTPHMPKDLPHETVDLALGFLVDELLAGERISDYTLWYYTPMALNYTDHLRPRAIIYDCMDELSKFKFAHPEMVRNEQKLMRRADLVFTGGHSLFEFKRRLHRNIHPFPSSIDHSHFSQARHRPQEPADQAAIPHPRLGFFGVIDERFDTDLLSRVAALRPDWNFVMIGPVVKIDPADLPRAQNIHYLGMKDYKQLPQYLAGWDVALMPFARNESTQFISPTKTPEYLAAGCPVVSTSIRDVVNPYGQENLVFIADEPRAFIEACEKAMHRRRNDSEWLVRVDEFLKSNSWDVTWKKMFTLEMELYKNSAKDRPASHVTTASKATARSVIVDMRV